MSGSIDIIKNINPNNENFFNSGRSSNIYKNNNNPGYLRKKIKDNDNNFSIIHEKNVYEYIIRNGKENLIPNYKKTNNNNNNLIIENLKTNYTRLDEIIKDNLLDDVLKNNIIEKVQELNSIGVYHRDLNLGNIFINKNNINDIKFIDFGLSITDEDLDYYMDNYSNKEIPKIQYLDNLFSQYFWWNNVCIEYLIFINDFFKNNSSFPNKDYLKKLLKYNDYLQISLNLHYNINNILAYINNLQKYFNNYISILDYINSLFSISSSTLTVYNQELYDNLFSIFNGYLPYHLHDFKQNEINNSISNIKQNQNRLFLKNLNIKDIIPILNSLEKIEYGENNIFYKFNEKNILIKPVLENEKDIYEILKDSIYIPRYYRFYEIDSIYYITLEYLNYNDSWINFNNFNEENYNSLIKIFIDFKDKGLYLNNISLNDIIINKNTNDIKFINLSKVINSKLIDENEIMYLDTDLYIKRQNELKIIYNTESKYYNLCYEYLNYTNNTIIEDKDKLKNILFKNTIIELGLLFIFKNIKEDNINTFIKLFRNKDIKEIKTLQENIKENIKDNNFLDLFNIYFNNINPYTDSFNDIENIFIEPSSKKRKR